MSPTPERLETIGGKGIEAVYQETTVEPRNRRTVISNFASFAADQVSEIAKKFARFERKAYELSGFTVDQFSREPLCLNPVVACKYNDNCEWYLCSKDQLVALAPIIGADQQITGFVLQGQNERIEYMGGSPEEILDENKESGFIGVWQLVGDEIDVKKLQSLVGEEMTAQAEKLNNVIVVKLFKKMIDGLEKGMRG